MPQEDAKEVKSLVGDPDAKSTRVGVQEYVAGGTLVAVVIYGAVRFADTAFYARLGTSPSAVGLTYAETLSRVAGSIVLFIAVVALLFLLGRSTRFSFDKPSVGGKGKAVEDEEIGVDSLRASQVIDPPQKPTHRKPVVVPLLTFLAKLVLWFFCFGIVSVLLPPTPTVYGFRIIPFAFAVVIWLVGFVSTDHDIGRARSAFGRSRGVQAWSISLAVVIIFGLAGISGYRSAGDLIGNRPIPCGCIRLGSWNVSFAWSSSSQGFLGIDAPHASITSSKDSGVPTSAFYLGTSDGTAVLFDSETDKVLYVPASDVVISVGGTTVGLVE